MKKLISSIIFALFLTFPAMSEINVGLSTNDFMEKVLRLKPTTMEL